ncbi:MAG: hypothetical protein COB62_05050 [Piscirickettsiaceae bacterium]|nr:MAG: hypothetical protein COB62_05050 [Piscirickettsiaceae bacterium]
MKGLFNMILLLSFIAVLAGCGQKGDLYLPTEQVAQYVGL